MERRKGNRRERKREKRKLLKETMSSSRYVPHCPLEVAPDFNVETLEYKNITFTVWDVGGQHKVSQWFPSRTK